MATCSLCGKDRRVTVTVGSPKGAVGDGEPFVLCVPCWSDGARRERLGNMPAPEPAGARPKKGDKMGKSLVTGETYVATGEVITMHKERKSEREGREERSAAKEEVGSFDRHPNAPEPPKRDVYTGGIQYVPDEDGYW